MWFWREAQIAHNRIDFFLYFFPLNLIQKLFPQILKYAEGVHQAVKYAVRVGSVSVRPH